jgi:hypothetical protein
LKGIFKLFGSSGKLNQTLYLLGWLLAKRKTKGKVFSGMGRN